MGEYEEEEFFMSKYLEASDRLDGYGFESAYAFMHMRPGGVMDRLKIKR